MRNFFEKLLNPWQGFAPPATAPADAATNATGELVRSRPLHLARRDYQLAESTHVVDEQFQRLRKAILSKALQRHPGQAPRYQGEYGHISDRGGYFYVAPWNEMGWLFERSPTGWLVSQAEKIVERDTFMRRYEPWDVVSIMMTAEGQNIRLTSQRFGRELMSFSVYEAALARDLGIES